MPTPVYFSEMDSPLGKLTLCGTEGGLSGLFMESHRHHDQQTGTGWERGDERLAAAHSQLREYFTGARLEFDLPLDLDGTGFQRRVWEALLTVPYGESVSYAEIARRIGQPTAVRAVGLANGRNPVSIIVPCHRVIGANGSLTGYGGGLDRKRLLLAHEQQYRPRSTAAVGMLAGF